MKVADVMTRHVEFIGPDATAQDAASLMGELDVSALPIGSPEDLKGVITDRDLLYRVVAEGKDPQSTTVGEVASRDIVSVDPQQSLDEATRLMAEHQVRRLPVVEEDGRLVGIVAQADVATAGQDAQTGQLVEEISK